MDKHLHTAISLAILVLIITSSRFCLKI